MDNPEFLVNLIIELQEKLKDTEFYIYFEYIHSRSGDTLIYSRPQFDDENIVLKEYHVAGINGSILITQDKDKDYKRLCHKRECFHYRKGNERYEYLFISDVVISD